MKAIFVSEGLQVALPANKLTGSPSIVYSLPEGMFFNKKLWSNPNAKLRFFLLTLFLGMFLNAWLCATLVYPTNRYGTKMIWLIHLAFALILMTLSYEKPNKLENIRPFAR